MGSKVLVKGIAFRLTANCPLLNIERAHGARIADRLLHMACSVRHPRRRHSVSVSLRVAIFVASDSVVTLASVDCNGGFTCQ